MRKPHKGYTLEQAKFSESIGDHMAIDNLWLINTIEYLQAENIKLKHLLFLTDDVVSNVVMNDLTARQCHEFLKWEKDNDKDSI